MKKIGFISLIAALLLLMQSCGIFVNNDLRTGATTEKDEPLTAVETESHAAETDAKEDENRSETLKNQAGLLLSGIHTAKPLGTRLLIAATDERFFKGDGSETALTSDRVSRIEKIEQKLGNTVVIEEYSEEKLLQDLRAAVKSKEYFADVIAVPQRLLGQLVSEGLVKSIRTVPGIDVTAQYFAGDSLDAATAGHNVYAAASDAVFEPDKIYGVYFNKTLAEELGLDLYEYVKDGEFTLEKYAQCVKAAQDAGYEGAIVKGNTPYKRMLLLGSGFDFTSNALDETPAANTFTEEYKSICTTLSELDGAVSYTDPFIPFFSGNTLFCLADIASAERIKDSSTAWGLLPFPKMNGADGYSSYVLDEATVLCIPVNFYDDETAGDLVKAVCASSVGYIKYDYLYHCVTNVLRDSGSIKSLSLLLSGCNYDFSSMFSSGYGTLKSYTIQAFDDIMSGKMTLPEYFSKEASFNEYLNKTFAAPNR